ncbi:cobalt-precorrin-5B (C(1))-methyltransferase [Rhodoblastus acidophilus]|uniref:Cobalt-precorrin-5B C(1)-methyltransferase n=1 Tax=Candidatus Rhodoblastus alkanivorans TaxID=2954117 RepID=A0ABS9Z8X8_9HYPH|nr:cobalt-precorrin-5B (C(1))-methyltransferase [Candidatus Rhodoblastus alkanivorans]MCI4679295.1 cobalt-precorrin-5B (C(1))-methyltransferase [Candidatus Rhodoblastus alkanivorans]MCI4684078.1 cobalt-precorrin-5B (C(1))-methyltransferase [Candidatus Rhodoblastus alkanivorans]MDI4641398.1 cobalt-precorrin-5B (C(1))-methyltransferase [Rhodoblastus acidophilus]
MEKNAPELRRGWTTGACAAAAARAAYAALTGGDFPDPVTIRLPGGQTPAFALALAERGEGFCRAGVVKDAGDDPDVTHGALIVARVSRGAPGAGVTFSAGEGVGMVTRPGLPIGVGEPAINPMPRQMIREAIAAEATLRGGGGGDVHVEISIPGGEKIAERTLNARLGIIGGLSILGTTGIVTPFSCAAWISSIHRGIDVARASGLDMVAGATGSTSEAAIKALYALPDEALIDMGDFVGGMLKYLRKHPVTRVIVAGGMAKMTKLAQGLLDLHSKRGEVDLAFLAGFAKGETADAISAANSAKHAFEIAAAAGMDLAPTVADAAWRTAAQALGGTPSALEIVIFDRDGGLLARTGFRPIEG